MKYKKVYAVECLKVEAAVSVFGTVQSLSFNGMADSCIGVLPVFKTKTAARKFAGKKYGVLELEVVDEDKARGEK